MYFISNQEDYIVAASKSFLDKIGYRDICNISLALKNQQITFVEDDELKVSTFDKSFKYKLIELHSAFGKLNLYQLALESQISLDDENLDYLRKIKDGAIKSSDENFDVPKINKEQKDEHELEVIKIFGKDEDEESSKIELKEYSLDESSKNEINKSEQNFINKQIDTKEQKEEIDNKVNSEDTQLDDEFDKALSKIITQDTEEEVIKTEPQEKEELKKDYSKDIETEEIEAKVDKKIEDNISNKIEEQIQKEEDNLNKSQEFESQKEHKTKTKKSRLNKFASRFFPWGSKEEEEEEEIEFEDTPSGLSIANEIKPKDQKVDAKKVEIDTQKEIEVEKIEEDVKEDIESDIEKSIKETPSEIEEIDIANEIKNIPIKDEDLGFDTKTTKEIESTETKKVDTLIEEGVLDQILSTKVQNINLEENAKKLSISLDNYKMLLENFLEEIENYKNEIKASQEEIISMLSDASRLLSLDIVTTKLNDIKSSNNKELQIKELDRVVELLKDKLNQDSKSTNIADEIFEKKDELKAKTYNKDTSLPNDVIDITTAKNLLMQIHSKDFEFDAKRASDELNLPESLIYEFVDDFIKQSKEHLNVLVDAYNKNNIKTIQTTAHMLKGAASNLRLDEIANTLFKLQKENSLEKSGELIKEFVALLKGLEINVKGVESLYED